MNHTPCDFFAEIGGLMDKLFPLIYRDQRMTQEEISKLQDELWMLCEKEKQLVLMSGRMN